MRIVVKILSTIVDSLLVDSLFTDPLFSLQSPTSARDKRETAGDLRNRVVVGEGEFFFLALRARFVRSKRTKIKIKQRLCTGYIVDYHAKTTAYQT